MKVWSATFSSNFGTAGKLNRWLKKLSLQIGHNTLDYYVDCVFDNEWLDLRLGNAGFDAHLITENLRDMKTALCTFRDRSLVPQIYI